MCTFFLFHLNIYNLFHEQTMPTFYYNTYHFHLNKVFKTNFVFLFHVFFVHRSAFHYIYQNVVISLLCTSAFPVVL